MDKSQFSPCSALFILTFKCCIVLAASLKNLCTEGRFIIQVDQNDDLRLSFLETEIVAGCELLCNHSTSLFVVGDLKFYALMLGRTKMSGHWCIWCLMAPQE